MKKFNKRGAIFQLCYLPLVACTKDQLLGFIFNNRSTFVHSSLHLVLCGDDVYICKIKENNVPCHAVADKPSGKWPPRELVAVRDKKAM